MTTPNEIRDAAYAGDIQLLRQLVAAGGELNIIEEDGSPLFADIVDDLCGDEKDYRYDVVAALLELGANPNLLGQDEEKSSPLTTPMLRMDTRMLRLLLDAGADPNQVQGFNSSEILYDYALSDYIYRIFDLHLPEKATEEDRVDEDTWLRYLDRIAIKYGARRPDHLFVLREHGALTLEEFEERARK